MAPLHSAEGWTTRPDWPTLLEGVGPPAPAPDEPAETRDWLRGWQRPAARALNTSYRGRLLLLSLCADSRALLRSQSDGMPQPGSRDRDGAAIDFARRRKLARPRCWAASGVHQGSRAAMGSRRSAKLSSLPNRRCLLCCHCTLRRTGRANWTRPG